MKPSVAENVIQSLFAKYTGCYVKQVTIDGAYSFDVVVPYGYELHIFISIAMSIDIPYPSKADYEKSFHVEINHTGTKEIILITEKGGDPGETFLYKITNEDTGEVLIVSVPENGERLVQCPSGNYTVEKITEWAWRYEDGVCKQEMSITVSGDDAKTNPAHADFTNERNNKAWIGGENRKNNHFQFSDTENG